MSQSSLAPPPPPGDKRDDDGRRAAQPFSLKPIKRYPTQFLRPAPPFTSLERFLRSKTSYGSSTLVNHATPLPSLSKSRNGIMPIRAYPGAPLPDNDIPPARAPVSANNAASSAASVIKGQWTPEEDGLLIRLVKEHGAKKWSDISKKLVGRIGKQCRERWHNHLRPDIKKDNWSDEEDLLLVRSHRKLGNRWAKIAKRIPGRTENAIKNHWNATKRRQKSRRKIGKKNGSDIIINNGNTSTVLQDYILSLEAVNAVTTSTSSSSAGSTGMRRENNLFDTACIFPPSPPPPPPPAYIHHGYNGSSSADSSPVLYQTMFQEPPSAYTMFALDPTETDVLPDYCMLMYPNQRPTSEDTVIGSESYGLSSSMSNVNYINMSSYMSNTDQIIQERQQQPSPLHLLGMGNEGNPGIASSSSSSSSETCKRELDLMEMMSMATYDQNSQGNYNWCNATSFF